MIKKIIGLLISILVLSSCNVSFPKETLKQDAATLIKQETGKDCSIFEFGSTLYLDVCFEELATNDKQKITEIYESLQKIVSTIVRVPLSSDANVEYIVISAFDPKYQTLLRIFENIDDLKLYSNMLISREDYADRQLMEFEGPKRAKEVIENKYAITKEEYVARLIISQLNNSARANPFLATLIQALELRYSHIEKGDMYFASKSLLDNDEIKMLLEKILEKEVDKNIKKYKLFSMKSAILLDEENNVVFSIPIEKINL